MLVEPERTRYDVNFRVLRFPVRVPPFFWIATILLGIYPQPLFQFAQASAATLGVSAPAVQPVLTR